MIQNSDVEEKDDFRISQGQVRRMRALEARFQDYVLKKLNEAKRRTGDPLGSIRNFIIDLGAVPVARMLVDPQDVRDPPTGFLRLLRYDLARLTIEQAVVDFALTGLFTAAEVGAAKARLAIFNRSKHRSAIGG
jgi:hypothetical protein